MAIDFRPIEHGTSGSNIDFRRFLDARERQIERGEAVGSKRRFERTGKVDPSFGGQIVRGITKPVARLGVNILGAFDTINGEDFATANRVRPTAFFGGLKPVGTSGHFGRDVLDAVGVGADIASTVAGGGAATSIIKSGAKGAVKQAAKIGLKEGAMTGGLAGLGQSLQDEESTLTDTALNTIGGLLLGGGIGAAGGAISAKVGRGLARRTSLFPETKTRLDLDEALDVTAPVIRGGKKGEQAIKRSGVERGGLFKTGRTKVKPTKFDKEVAESVAGIVKSRRFQGKNQEAIEQAVSEIDNSIKAHLKETDVPFNTNQLLKQLNSGKDDLKLVFASDATADRTYDAVVEALTDSIEKNNLSGLFEARQNFDQLPAIRKLLDSEPVGENTRREIVRTVRKLANEYVADNLPEEVGETFTKQLRQEHLMLEARDRIVDQLNAQLGKNAIQRFFRTPSGEIIKFVVTPTLMGSLGFLGTQAVAEAFRD